jgi:hypothetical protein
MARQVFRSAACFMGGIALFGGVPALACDAHGNPEANKYLAYLELRGLSEAEVRALEQEAIDKYHAKQLGIARARFLRGSRLIQRLRCARLFRPNRRVRRQRRCSKRASARRFAAVPVVCHRPGLGAEAGCSAPARQFLGPYPKRTAPTQPLRQIFAVRNSRADDLIKSSAPH